MTAKKTISRLTILSFLSSFSFASIFDMHFIHNKMYTQFIFNIVFHFQFYFSFSVASLLCFEILLWPQFSCPIAQAAWMNKWMNAFVAHSLSSPLDTKTDSALPLIPDRFDSIRFDSIRFDLVGVTSIKTNVPDGPRTTFVFAYLAIVGKEATIRRLVCVALHYTPSYAFVSFRFVSVVVLQRGSVLPLSIQFAR